MKFTVKDPSSGLPLLLEARPEQYLNEAGYWISYPNGSGFFISNKFGTWRPLDGRHIEPEILIQIGLAIEGQQS